MSAELATVSFRTESGVAENEPWPVVDSAELSSTVPWRTFRWYEGRQHYSGLASTGAPPCATTWSTSRALNRSADLRGLRPGGASHPGAAFPAEGEGRREDP